jgi:biotin carboxyl carrier protein
MTRQIATIVLGFVLLGIGLVSGWYAARQGADAGVADDAATAKAPLSEQTLKNLGVSTGTAALSDFVRHVRVQATVIDAPLSARPIPAPLGGTVTALHGEPGEVVRAGEPLITIAREPIPRPKLELTAEFLTAVSENTHETVSTLRTALSQLRIVQKELARVRKFADTDGEISVVPVQKVIDLEYDLARAQQQVENARRELERHGLSGEEIDAVAEGEHPPGNPKLWRRVLEENGLWGEAEEAILNSLPPRQRNLPWTIAAIGELSAAGLANADLLGALMEQPHLGVHFVEVASLLRDGNTVAKVRLLAKLGALEPEMVVRAPADVADWDLAQIEVRPGQQVTAGETLAVLHDPRTMWLRLEPVGEEMRHVVEALRSGAEIGAEPLIDGTGPALEGLHIDRLDTRGSQHERGARAYVICRNEPVPLGHLSVIIRTPSPGLAAAEVEKQVTATIESSLLAIEEIVSMASRSSDGESVVRARFRPGVDLERIRRAVSTIGRDTEVALDRKDTRSWKLRVGLRYLVLVPSEVLPQRFVLPAGAVTENGIDRVVFVPDGDSFAPRTVHVEYEDDEVVVIANDGAIFAGETVVKSGAFALGLALQTESGAIDPHAGHDHG